MPTDRQKKKPETSARSDAVWSLQTGARVLPEGGVAFKVWAPRCGKLRVKWFESGRSQFAPMEKDEQGFFSTEIPQARAGLHYLYQLNQEVERADPVSRLQAESVHGPSVIVDPKFPWKDKAWKGLGTHELILYELHIGTFSPEGSFEVVQKKISYLKELGITGIEIMPVAQFPGKKNWGYDGVGLYSVQNTYGGPLGLKKLVNACHQEGMAVALDVVYNHLGPEGNYLDQYGPYFTDKYHTPWGRAFNYDDRDSGPVRQFVIDNALYWISEYHIDILRLDAVQGIFDFSARPLLEELTDAVHKQAETLGRRAVVIAESDLNDSKLIREKKHSGYGMDSQWSDDFHHSVHAYLTGERRGYYEDYGTLSQLSKAIQKAFVYDGTYSKFRRRRYGTSTNGLAGEKFVIGTQNHDQVGNRPWGERLSSLISFEEDKIAACILLFSPYIPLLFMGQEYAERAPFQYFIDHGDPELVKAVVQGRKKEFESFGWKKIPDPVDPETFQRSCLNWNLMKSGQHAQMLRLYRDLIQWRKKIKILTDLKRQDVAVDYDEEALWISMEYRKASKGWALIASFAKEEQAIKSPFRGQFQPKLHTASVSYGGKLKREVKFLPREIVLDPKCAVIGKLEIVE